MQPSLILRPENEDDCAQIGCVIRAAFQGMPFASGTEAKLVEALRHEGLLSVSMVAELDGRIVGQVAFSPAQSNGDQQRWYALGPLAVQPAHQRQGVGSRLVLSGLQAIVALGASGCILIGNPLFYGRFGFEVSPSHAPEGQPSEYFMVRSFGGELPAGPIAFHAKFTAALV